MIIVHSTIVRPKVHSKLWRKVAVILEPPWRQKVDFSKCVRLCLKLASKKLRVLIPFLCLTLIILIIVVVDAVLSDAPAGQMNVFDKAHNQLAGRVLDTYFS